VTRQATRLARSRNVLGRDIFGRDTDRFPLVFSFVFTVPLNMASENFGFRLESHLPSPAAASVCATGARDDGDARAKARLVDSSLSNPIFRSFEPTQRPSAPSARLAFRDQRAILVRWSPASTAGSTMSTMYRCRRCFQTAMSLTALHGIISAATRRSQIPCGAIVTTGPWAVNALHSASNVQAPNSGIPTYR